VPKPHTPMQWCGMRDAAYFWSVRDRLRSLAQRSPVQFKFHWIERSVLEGILCRGDRRVGRLIEAAWRNGARLDSWDEHFNYSLWTSALEQTGLAGLIDNLAEIPLDAPLPWSHIGGFRETEFLANEYQRMKDILAEG
ncbi:MAG: B12-binding domain-containing radical SAM protein, partial [Planctomycetota bacterium]|nr:B12-binding domain-containing radical SAM protein [Planctomycetota bacterium]